ncbi:MAG: ferrous iron transport protein A [Opitutales bacterium]
MEATLLLSQLKPGQLATVASLESKDPASLRLREMGLLPGTRIELLRFAPLGDPLEVRVRGFCLSLRRKDASQVTVNPLEA